MSHKKQTDKKLEAGKRKAKYCHTEKNNNNNDAINTLTMRQQTD